MKNQTYIRRMTGMAILIALIVVFGEISNYVTISNVNINLALIPIVVGACIYGPVSGLILGLIDGIIVLTAPGTLASFFPYSPFGTILVCLIKTAAAGYFSGVLYKVLHQKNSLVASILAALIVPIVNTGLFLIGVYLWFLPLYKSWMPDSSANVTAFIMASTLTVNFLIEFIVNLVLAPTVHRIVLIASKNYNIGSVYQEKDDQTNK